MERSDWLKVLIFLLLLIGERVGLPVFVSVAWIIGWCWNKEDLKTTLFTLFVAGILRDLVFLQPLGVSSIVLLVGTGIFAYMKKRFETASGVLVFVMGMSVHVLLWLVDSSKQGWLGVLVSGLVTIVVFVLLGRFESSKKEVKVIYK